MPSEIRTRPARPAEAPPDGTPLGAENRVTSCALHVLAYGGGRADLAAAPARLRLSAGNGASPSSPARSVCGGSSRPRCSTRWSALPRPGTALRPVTVAELYSGMTEKRRAKWEAWLLALPYWQIGVTAAIRAGIYRKKAAESGRTLSVSDSLLAALAHEYDATLLTSNIKDCPMKDIRVQSLREQAA
jgi:predicted nucleic acid-binding protein